MRYALEAGIWTKSCILNPEIPTTSSLSWENVIGERGPK